MRQTFEVTGGPDIGPAHLPLIRGEMNAQGLDIFYVPHEDAYQNEYLPEAYDRLAWATGFTGSAGSAVILQDSAIVFVDGRYTIQAAQQLDPAVFERMDLTTIGPFKWIASQNLAGKTIGFDAHLMNQNEFKRLQAASVKAGATLIEVSVNPIDAAWKDQPSEPLRKVVPHALEYAGETHESKRKRIGSKLFEDRVDAAVLTSPASIAWLFNIRGSDVKCSPLPLGRAIIHSTGEAELYLNPQKVDSDLTSHLSGVTVSPISQLESALKKLAGKTVSLDPNLASRWFFNQLEAAGAHIVEAMDPTSLPKACKNAIEIEGSQRAHIRDGAAIVRFLRWLETDDVQKGNITEIDAAQKLESYREELQGLKDLSFESISGAGPNGAICHYRVNEKTNRILDKNSLYLIDSGGQYLDGTTDITRTVAIGEPTQEMRERYTSVLKGHIALCVVRFPAGTTGSALDAIARAPLWKCGLDYDHGTGHGVGSYLGVHEGPQRISKAPNTIALEPGMIVSNEPGYYKEDGYGIRIENLQYVTKAQTILGGDQPMLGFATLTLAPLDHRLIESGMLTPDEWRWVDNYHARVLKELSPILAGADLEWLKHACRELT